MAMLSKHSTKLELTKRALKQLSNAVEKTSSGAKLIHDAMAPCTTTPEYCSGTGISDENINNAKKLLLPSVTQMQSIVYMYTLSSSTGKPMRAWQAIQGQARQAHQDFARLQKVLQKPGNPDWRALLRLSSKILAETKCMQRDLKKIKLP